MAAPSPREENVYMAKLAEQAEWYEKMVQYMEKVIVSASTSEEPPLRRLQERHRRTARLLEYRLKIEAELTEICSGILKLLDQKLVPTAAAADSKVFYLKMKGDYLLSLLNLAEFKTGDERKVAVENTLNAYKSAQV
ncbi:hypothetical protein CISIN_1g045389mg [Citrus sinensis]|uniref:14-3-3 domain-containing protein n=1 Tax=Citrus sinensis TaxID=2711 RepID=A0A067CZ92_CITSI|nr:hypothetical protein CISIN_1g045389mg [Citrus sinensis]